MKWILQFKSLRSLLFLLSPLDLDDSKHSQWHLAPRCIDVPAKAVLLLLPCKEARDVRWLFVFLERHRCMAGFVNVVLLFWKSLQRNQNLCWKLETHIPSRNSHHSIFPCSVTHWPRDRIQGCSWKAIVGWYVPMIWSESKPPRHWRLNVSKKLLHFYIII